MCSAHLTEDLQVHRIEDHVNSKEELERYVYDLHERVNVRRNKQTMHTFEEVQAAFKGPWKGLGGYPYPATTETLQKHKDKAIETAKVNLKTEERTRRITTIFIVTTLLLAVSLGVTGTMLYKHVKTTRANK
jgi:hypothetical protein